MELVQKVDVKMGDKILHKKKMLIFTLTLVMILFLFSCSNNSNGFDGTNQSDIIAVEQEYIGQIYLYGEQHGDDNIIEREFELWYDYYYNHGMRHLFIESSYYSAEFLNVWMQSDKDEILDELFVDLKGTSWENPIYREFFEKVKLECPETVFHGTDVGHQYTTTGKRYLKFLQENNLVDSEQYEIAKEVIEQGEIFYKDRSAVYRENMMVENFIRELDTLTNENIMGIYGSAHTGIENLDNTNSIPCMANQLNKIYVNRIYSESLVHLAKPMEAKRIDVIEIHGKDYQALYYGKRDMDFTNEYQYREYWRLENAYDDFKDNILTMDVLPESNFPIPIEKEQVFIVDYTKADGSVVRKYYRVDGYTWEKMVTSEEFVLKKIDKRNDPERVETINIAGKDYMASYFGKNNMDGLLGCQYIEYWRLEEAYADFKDNPLDGSTLPYSFLPVTIESGQVFVIDIAQMDGDIKRGFFRSDGNEWRSKLSIEGFTVEN